MCMTKMSVLLLLAMLICVSVSQLVDVEKPVSHFEMPDEKLPEEKIIVDKVPEFKKEIEDLEKNGKSMEDECFGSYCFQVKQPPGYYYDYDCCCPTRPLYYYPRSFTENGATWYPVSGQWSKAGRCLSTNQVCHKKSWPFSYQRCRQLYQWTAFIYYRIHPFFQIKIKYFYLPDYCYCPCGRGIGVKLEREEP